MVFPRCRHLCLALSALAVLVAAASRVAAVEPDLWLAQPQDSASVTPVEPAMVDLFAVLGDEDARLYGEIFRLQDDGKWKAADKRIAELSDRILMGHVLYQRYMHPRAYRSTYMELKNWMKDYADHPNADQVYRLAAKRRPKNYLWPRQPRSPSVNVAWNLDVPLAASESESPPSVRRHTNRNMRYAQARIRRWLRMGAPTRAYNYLSGKDIARHFDAIGYDEMLTSIAAKFYEFDKDEKAFELAGAAAERSGKYVPDAHWWAGLTAWRTGQFPIAADHFAALARSGIDDEWLASAGAYWAARAYLVSRQPDKVVPMLQLAAEQPMTFYGVLGQEALGLRHAIDWSVPVADVDAAREIVGIPAARRGLALLQIGQDRRGMGELKRIFDRLPPRLLQTMMAYADEAQIAPLAFELGRSMQERDGHWHGAALYPLPVWEPTGGFQLDRALIYALMRQESNFKTTAKSHAGARGLMQLMPGTAGFISGRRYRGWRSNKLYNPELNLTLGQKYMVHLLETPSINGSLFLAVAAYNGGPGNLRSWLRRVDFKDDPLLFIESIPRRETRIYVERVLTNFWLYRDRLGQPRPSLEDVVAGSWPVYSALDPLNKQIAYDRNSSEELR